MSVSSNVRSSQTARPTSPHTPQQTSSRSTNTSFASTTSAGSSFRNEDDAIIIEIGARWLRAGFEGSGTPTCTVTFGPEESRRVGDYRGWISGGTGNGLSQQPVDPEDWVRDYEIWRPDVREMDLGLLEDKIERLFRETFNKYLLTDAGSSRLVLTLPSLMPHPLLSSLLSTLFSRWRFPNITLLPSAAMSATAAGLRSALVIDLGWAETTVTGLYEYREVTSKRSTRAMKSLQQEMGRCLDRLASGDELVASPEGHISVGFAYCEEILARIVWCRPHAGGHEDPPTATQKVSIPSPVNPGEEFIDVPFSRFADPVDTVLLASGTADGDLDDEEKPIPLLVYHTLLALPPDARGICMSRIVFVGGGSRIPGLRKRVLEELSLLIKQYGWSPVRGKALERQRQRLESMRISSRPPTQAQAQAPPARQNEGSAPDPPKVHSSEEEPEMDFVEQKLRRQNKESYVPIHGVVREVESLGAWAGASLVTSLKLRGMVEIEREKFLQHGLAGASRESEPVVPDRRSGLRAGDRSSWTLAGWA
ncbi:hypothetical protein N7539_001641 [Penicillium diatomitis]|uniref:Actin-related protein RO7 n=1 Tax=Penicillium diatomitis TaxID=2819901 RepID=A0A9X0C0A4_9EURO|nr:uncharacterized protein N7539_001641 [Penicillium diatomitis]KAJ5492895.1 hypothetical protein N7539_001641 [Penicillium diatomitis]